MSFVYPAAIVLFILVLLAILAFLSDLMEPTNASIPVGRLKAVRVRLHDLIWSPPFLRHWQFMRPFFSLTVAKLFITWFAVVPVAAHLLSKVPDTVKIPQNCTWTVELGPISRPDESTRSPPQNWANAQSHCTFLEFPIELPFNWQLLWFASFLFFLAFAIYSIACPRFIKRYPDYAAYLLVGHSIRWIVWEFYYMDTPHRVRNSVEERLITKAHAQPTDEAPTAKPIVTAESTYFVFQHGTKQYCLSSPIGQIDGSQRAWEQDVFWEVFEGWTKSRLLFASTIRWLVFLAGAITAYIVCQNILAAAVYIWHAI